MSVGSHLAGGRVRAVTIAATATAIAVASSWLWWTYRVVATGTSRVLTFDNYDTYAYYYPTFAYAFRQLRAGHFPLWNPYQLCGTPFFATAQHLLLYPLNLAFLLLPTAAALQVTALLHLALGLLFSALLARVFGLGWAAAAVVAAAFVFSPAVASLVTVPHHLYAVVWIPLHLALTRLMLMRPGEPRWAILLGTTLTAQFLGGYPMFCLFSAYALLAYTAWWALTQWRAVGTAHVARAGIALAGAGLLALLLSAPQLLPALELSKLSVRSLDALDIETADPHFPATERQTIVLQTLLPAPSHPYRFLAMTPAPGWIVLALILAAPFNRRQRNAAAFFALLAVVTYLIGLGRHAPLYELYFALPGSNLFRVPARFFALTAVPVAMLAGIGADGLARLTDRPRAGIVVLGLVIAAAAGLAVWVHVSADAIANSGVLTASWTEPGLVRRLRVGAVHLGITALWLAFFLASAGRWRTAVVAALPLAVFASLAAAHYNRLVLPELDPDLLRMPDPVVAYLRREQGLARTHVPTIGFNPRGTPLLPPKFGLRYGLYDDMDRENTYARRYAEYTRRLVSPEMAAMRASFLAAKRAAGLDVPQGDYSLTPTSPNLQLLNLMGTRFIVESPSSVFLGANPSDRFPLRFADEGVRVVENPEALPRAFTVRRAEVVAADAVLDRMTDPAFDPRTTVILEEPPGIELDGGAAEGSTRIVSYEPDRVVIDTETAAPSLLVLTDQYYPGWRASVDDAPTPLLRADYLFRAVAVPPGRHRVEFRFVSDSFRRGLALAGGALLVLAGFGIVATKRRV